MSNSSDAQESPGTTGTCAFLDISAVRKVRLTCSISDACGLSESRPSAGKIPSLGFFRILAPFLNLGQSAPEVLFLSDNFSNILGLFTH